MTCFNMVEWGMGAIVAIIGINILCWIFFIVLREESLRGQ